MSDDVRHLTLAELEAGLEQIRQAPRDAGTVEMIVRRPARDEREVLGIGQLDAAAGLVGDSWRARAKGEADPDTQLTLMASRVVALLAGERERWPLAGDQLFVDLALEAANLPPGTRLSLGDALIEITAEPHTGCKKFIARYGLDAMRFVNSAAGRELNLRGIYARVVEPGAVRVNDVIRKV